MKTNSRIFLTGLTLLASLALTSCAAISERPHSASRAKALDAVSLPTWKVLQSGPRHPFRVSQTGLEKD